MSAFVGSPAFMIPESAGHSLTRCHRPWRGRSSPHITLYCVCRQSLWRESNDVMATRPLKNHCNHRGALSAMIRWGLPIVERDAEGVSPAPLVHNLKAHHIDPS